MESSPVTNGKWQGKEMTDRRPICFEDRGGLQVTNAAAPPTPTSGGLHPAVGCRSARGLVDGPMEVTQLALARDFLSCGSWLRGGTVRVRA